MTHKIFIDGEAGTTGLQIAARLEARADLDLIHLDDASRKDAGARKAALAAADIAILCLPDDAAREAVALADGQTRIIDASTAHRTDPGWVFGFPELEAGQQAKIKDAKLVANPGCYALSSISLLRPLVASGLIPADFPISINAVSGYSGGGKALIKRMEEASAEDAISAEFYVYGLGLAHKHVPEIQAHGLLTSRPLFVPSVGRFAQGMIVQIPLHLASLPGNPSVADVRGTVSDWYAGRRFVQVASAGEAADNAALLDPEALNGTNELKLYVFGNDDAGHVVLAAVSDNLGKGASGSAVQNLNIMLGLPEETGLDN